MPDWRQIKQLLRLSPLLRRHPKVTRTGSEAVEDFRYFHKTNILTWNCRYEGFGAKLDGGYLIDLVEAVVEYSFSSRKARVVNLAIDNVRPLQKVIQVGADEQTKRKLVDKLEKETKSIFEDVLRKATK